LKSLLFLAYFAPRSLKSSGALGQKGGEKADFWAKDAILPEWREELSSQ